MDMDEIINESAPLINIFPRSTSSSSLSSISPLSSFSTLSSPSGSSPTSSQIISHPYFDAVIVINNTEDIKKAIQTICDATFNTRQKLGLRITKKSCYLFVDVTHSEKEYQSVLVFGDPSLEAKVMEEPLAKEFSCERLPALFNHEHSEKVKLMVMKGGMELRVFPMLGDHDLGARDPLILGLECPEKPFAFFENSRREVYFMDDLELIRFREAIQDCAEHRQFSAQFPRVRRDAEGFRIGPRHYMKGLDCFWEFTWPFLNLFEDSSYMANGGAKLGLLADGKAVVHIEGPYFGLGFTVKSDNIIMRYKEDEAGPQVNVGVPVGEGAVGN